MKDFVITTDSTSDLPDSYLQNHGIEMMSLDFVLDGKTYKHGELDPKEFYAIMREGKLPTTNACNPEDVKECFRRNAAQGKGILHIAFSSGLSASFSNAHLAAGEIRDEYPDIPIIVVDSLCASLGEGLLVHKAVKLREQGKSLEETAEWIEANKLHLCHQFTVDNLFHLHRGGRVSKATAIVGTMINVKPVLHVDNEGHLIPLCNVRGRKKSLTRLVDNMADTMKEFAPQNDTVFISHGDCIEDAQFVADLIRTKLGIQDILIHYVSPTIGSHSGPGTVALFYMGAVR